jgi:hypothetical protein
MRLSQPDRCVPAEAEEEAPDQVGGVDRHQAPDTELGEEGAQREEGAAEDERDRGNEVYAPEPADLPGFHRAAHGCSSPGWHGLGSEDGGSRFR